MIELCTRALAEDAVAVEAPINDTTEEEAAAQ
jgi:hypothetical protein